MCSPTCLNKWPPSRDDGMSTLSRRKYLKHQCCTEDSECFAFEVLGREARVHHHLAGFVSATLYVDNLVEMLVSRKIITENRCFDLDHDIQWLHS